MDKGKKICLFLQVYFKFCIRKDYLSERGIKICLWKRKFYNLIKAEDDRSKELLYEFLTCKMKKISNNKITRVNKYSPILFCVIKNDYKKIKQFMTHYRKLGVEVFVFLDNCSTDGTMEFLCNQRDTIVYSSNQEYSSARRVAWINRLLAMYGENRWCIVVDSDELLTYIGSEKNGIDKVVKRAIESGYRRIEGFMLDMYSENSLFETDSLNCFEKMKWFDCDTYDLRMQKQGLVISGGPRKRIFKRREHVLSKYPLFYFGQDDFVASSHYMVPVIQQKKVPIWIAICHYKFSDDKDLKKIKEAVIKENYAGNSADYKIYLKYINQNQKLTFYDPHISTYLNSSEDLRKIRFLKRIFEDA